MYILTRAYYSPDNFQQQIDKFAAEWQVATHKKDLPHVVLLPTDIDTSQLPSMYKSMDAFVLPSRGEGWGRPHVEAMSMELPIIATNWSGPTEFLNESNGYPLHVESIDIIKEKGEAEGHYWSTPSVPHLRQLMRQIHTNPQEAKAKGKKARETMVERFCPRCVAQTVLKELARIGEIMKQNDQSSLTRKRRARLEQSALKYIESIMTSK